MLPLLGGLGSGSLQALDLLSFIDDITGGFAVAYEIVHYLTANGRDVFSDWLDSQRNVIAIGAITGRLNRLGAGNFGDHSYCRDGVWELRIDVGTGYRVYYAIAGREIVLLLCGGDKRSQTSDITKACEYRRDFQRRGDNEK